MSVASVTSKGCADTQGQRPENILMSEGNAATRATLIWVACAATWTILAPGPGQFPRAMSRSMVLLWLRSVLIFMARVTTGVIGTKCLEI